MSKSQAHNGRYQCPQCGADIGLLLKRRLANCPFCGSRLHLDSPDNDRQWMLKPALMRSECHRILSAWLWENYQGSANGMEIEESVWVPWVKRELKRNGEAAGHKYLNLADDKHPYLSEVAIPPGEYLQYDQDGAAGFSLPRISDGDLEPADTVIYVPFYIAGFNYGGERRAAVIEASTGSMAGYLPERKSDLARKAGSLALAGLVFLLEALIIKPVLAKTIVLGLSFVILEVLISLAWEGWGWRK